MSNTMDHRAVLPRPTHLHSTLEDAFHREHDPFFDAIAVDFSDSETEFSDFDVLSHATGNTTTKLTGSTAAAAAAPAAEAQASRLVASTSDANAADDDGDDAATTTTAAAAAADHDSNGDAKSTATDAAEEITDAVYKRRLRAMLLNVAPDNDGVNNDADDNDGSSFLIGVDPMLRDERVMAHAALRKQRREQRMFDLKHKHDDDGDATHGGDDATAAAAGSTPQVEQTMAEKLRVQEQKMQERVKAAQQRRAARQAKRDVAFRDATEAQSAELRSNLQQWLTEHDMLEPDRAADVADTQQKHLVQVFAQLVVKERERKRDEELERQRCIAEEKERIRLLEDAEVAARVAAAERRAKRLARRKARLARLTGTDGNRGRSKPLPTARATTSSFASSSSSPRRNKKTSRKKR
jgi:hypothetical protein